MKDVLKRYLADLSTALSSLDHRKLQAMAEKILATRRSASTVFLIGNGGCAATASHSACDWGRELGIRTVCFSDNAATLTARANDFGYDDVFHKQLEVFLSPGDLLVAYSGSGSSQNVVRAVDLARARGNYVIGVTGNYNGGRGGELARRADLAIVISSESMERIEDIVLVTSHVVREYMRSTTSDAADNPAPV